MLQRKAVSITYSEYVFVALGIHNSMRMPHIFLCGLSDSISFSTLSHKWHEFRKKKLLNTKFVFWLSLQPLSESYLILRRIARDMIKICIGLYINYLLFLSYFIASLIFSKNFFKIFQYQSIWKFVRWESRCSMRIDGETDKTKLNTVFAFRCFVNAPKNCWHILGLVKIREN